jgi:redox-regulated HSP33 family molecular chaperone
MLNAINLLSQNEKEEMIEQGEDIEIKCDFCLKSIKIKVDNISK